MSAKTSRELSGIKFIIHRSWKAHTRATSKVWGREREEARPQGSVFFRARGVGGVAI